MLIDVALFGSEECFGKSKRYTWHWLLRERRPHSRIHNDFYEDVFNWTEGVNKAFLVTCNCSFAAGSLVSAVVTVLAEPEGVKNCPYSCYMK